MPPERDEGFSSANSSLARNSQNMKILQCVQLKSPTSATLLGPGFVSPSEVSSPVNDDELQIQLLRMPGEIISGSDDIIPMKLAKDVQGPSFIDESTILKYSCSFQKTQRTNNGNNRMNEREGEDGSKN